MARRRQNLIQQLSAELGKAPPRRRSVRTLSFDHGEPIECEVSDGWSGRVEKLRYQTPAGDADSNSMPMTSLRELETDVARFRIEEFTPAARAQEPVPAGSAGEEAVDPVVPANTPAAVVPPQAPAAPVEPVEPAPLPSPSAGLEPAIGVIPGEQETLSDDELRDDVESITGIPRTSPAPPLSPGAISQSGGSAASKGRRAQEPSEPLHAAFDRIQSSRAMGPAVASARAADSNDVFDRLSRSRSYPRTFDVGSFSVQKQFDEFDTRLGREADADADVNTTPLEEVGGQPITVVESPLPAEDAIASSEIEADLDAIRGTAGHAPPPSNDNVQLPMQPAMHPPEPAKLPAADPSAPVPAHLQEEQREDAATAAQPLIGAADNLSPNAAAAAMVVAARMGWADVASADIVAGTGPWAPYRAALQLTGADVLAPFGLAPVAEKSFDAATLRALLMTHGPLWIAPSDAPDQARVVIAITGEGTPEQVSVRIHDPAGSAPGVGLRYVQSYAEFSGPTSGDAAPQFLVAYFNAPQLDGPYFNGAPVEDSNPQPDPATPSPVTKQEKPQ